jgi:quinol---cytochrome-c reductase cytochrome c subunit
MTAPLPRRPGLLRRLGATRRAPRGRLARRVWTATRLVAALLLVGGAYAAFAPGMQASADDTVPLSAAAAEGKTLYETSCISCHGRNAQGVPDRGPSLIGAGSAAVYLQVTTGRMPAPGQGAQIERRTPVLTVDQARQIGAYIEALGGGPALPTADLGGGDVAAGGELFRVNCSSCHAFGAGGGALSSGKFAPGLNDATAEQMYAAMLTGPQNMPVFGDNQLSFDEKRAIIAYLQNLQSDPDPGGWGLGRLGPVPEGLAIFLIGMVVLVFTTVWIAGKQS